MTENTQADYSDSLLTDILLRIYVAGAVGCFALAAFSRWQTAPERITLLVLALIESITAVIAICSHRARRRDWRPLSMLASFVAMFFFLALDLAPGQHVLPEKAGAALQIVGLLFHLYATLSLGRSFGVLPATRRLVTRGAYQWLRHPMYFGYFISHIGFLLSNFSLQNLLVLTVLYAAQLVRIHREEEMLATLPGYLNYCRIVRYRLIPGIY